MCEITGSNTSLHYKGNKDPGRKCDLLDNLLTFFLLLKSQGFVIFGAAGPTHLLKPSAGTPTLSCLQSPYWVLSPYLAAGHRFSTEATLIENGVEGMADPSAEQGCSSL